MIAVVRTTVSLLAIFFAGRVTAGELVVVPPCTDWRVTSLTNGEQVRLYCYASRETWLPLEPRCTGRWRPSRNSRGWLVLTCDQASVAIYPRPL